MRTKMSKLIVALALGAVICLPGMAQADWNFTVTGYYDNYPESGGPVTGPIDKIDVSITSGTFDFANPGMIDYGGQFSGWTVNNINSKFVQATNIAAPSSAGWNYTFAGTGPVYPFTLDWNAYDNGVFKVHEHIALDSSGGISGYYDTNPAQMVPLPPSVLLLGSGLLGLGFLPRRKKSEV